MRDGPGFEILYLDEHCLVVNKPPGILTQAPPGIDSLEERVRAWLESRQLESPIPLPPSDLQKTPTEYQRSIVPLPEQGSPLSAPHKRHSEYETSSSESFLRSRAENPGAETRGAAGQKLYLGTPHRLDRPVSGAVVFALTRRAAQRLSAQFERRSIKKLYWACLEGRVEPAEGAWKDFLRKLPDQPRAEIVPMDHPEALYAVLYYRVLAYLDWGSWVEIRLDTGRYHQIRIQAASRGHPVLGDVQYGSRQPFGPPVQDVREQPIALHARTLVFRHPKTKQTLIIRASPPDYWKKLHLPETTPYSAADPPCSPWEGIF